MIIHKRLIVGCVNTDSKIFIIVQLKHRTGLPDNKDAEVIVNGN